MGLPDVALLKLSIRIHFDKSLPEVKALRSPHDLEVWQVAFKGMIPALIYPSLCKVNFLDNIYLTKFK